MKSQALLLDTLKSHQVKYAVGCLLVLLSLVALMNAPASLAVALLSDRVLGVHIVLELFAIVIAVLIATTSWQIAELRRDSTASIMMLGFMVVACCDLMHMLTFKGMPAFITQSDPERGLFFWLTGRSVEVLTLLYLTIGRVPVVSRSLALTLGMALSFVIVWVGSFHLDLFPRTFIEGVGLTPFKVKFEYALCALNLATALLLARRAAQTGSNQFRLLAMSSFVMGIGELSFTSYMGMSDFQTHAGHIYKVVAYALLYRSTYTANVLAPMEALRMAEHDLRTVLDALPSMVGYCDHHLINRIANKAFFDWFGVEGATMPGRHVRELMGEDLFRKSLPYMEAALRGEPQTFERSIPRPDGQGVRHALTQYLPDWQDGKVAGFYFTVHDVSALKEAQRAQQEALAELSTERQRLDAILRGAEVGTWDCDLDTGELRIDERWAGILGYTAAELRPHIDIRSELAHPAELAFSRERLREHLQGRTPMFDEECRLRHRDGHWVWVLDRGRVSARDARGRALRIQGTLLDISTVKLVQARLAEREAFLERVSEVAEVGGWQFDVATGAITLSRETCRISGVPDDFQPTLEESLAFYPEDARQLIRKSVRAAIEHNQSFDWEVPYQNAQGQPLWIRIVGEAVFDDDSPGARPTRVIGAFQNITERNHAAQAIQRANERLALAVGSAGMGVWEFDLQADTLTWDDQMYALYGRTRSGEAEPYALWRDSLHPGDRAYTEQALIDAIAGKRAFNVQFRIFRADSSLRHLRAEAHVTRDASGAPLRVVGVNLDVTDQLGTAAALLENQQLLQRVGSLADIGGWRVDIKAGTVYWSEQTRRIHEVPPDFEPSIATGISFYAPEHRELISEAVQQGIDSGTPWDLELRFITYTGRRIWVRALGEVEFERGRAAYLVGALQDITERREVEDRLRAVSVAAEAASAAKSAFLANMSHEIRTPLNAMLGIHRMLRGTDLKSNQSQLLRKADHAGHALMEIINDVLDLAKIDAGEMSLDEQPFLPRQLLQELNDIHGLVAQSKGLELAFDIHSDVPTWLVGDRARLRQVLGNLLGNAIKFTSSGVVSLSVRVRDDDSQQQVEMVVQDSGVGIAHDAIGRLFAPFVQADESTTRQFGGTGLGLSIVRKLARMMGGDVYVSSTLGVGSEFTVVVPLTEADERSIARTMRENRPIQVALMCADESMCLDMRRRLAGMGWTCFRPMAGEFGDPDVLLMDAAVGVNGAKWLQELASARKNNDHELPAILLGDANELLLLEQQGLAYERIVRKPASLSTIFNALLEVLASDEGSRNRLISSSHAIDGDIHWLKGARVLVVDDSEINLEIAVALLQQQGANCHTSTNGQEAVDWLLANPDELDAVLMDVQMPVMDGLAATRLIKSYPAFKDLPVIALTAGALDSERLRAAVAGMDDFLTKPLEPLELVKVLRHKIGAYRGRILPVVLSQASTDEVLKIETGIQPWPEIAGIDGALAMTCSSNSISLFNKLLALLQKNYSEWGVTWLERVSQEHDGIASDLCASLHKLRGSAGTLGAIELATLAEHVENAIRLGSISLSEAVKKVARALEELLANVNVYTQFLESNQAVMAIESPLMQLEFDRINTLAELLSKCDLDALELGLLLQRDLASLMGQDAARDLLRRMDELDFKAAHLLLVQWLKAPHLDD